MNKKIIFGMISAFSALAVMVGVTFATFSSSASNTGNTFGAGTLVLAINGFGAAGSPALFNIANVAPGTTISDQVINLSNVGSVAASSVTLTSIGLTPNAPGELGEVLTLTLYNDVDDSSSFTAGDTTISSAHLNDAAWAGLSLGFGLPVSGHHRLIARISMDSGAGDSYQGKSISFDFNFIANQ